MSGLTDAERAGGWYEDGVWCAPEALVLGIVAAREDAAYARGRDECAAVVAAVEAWPDRSLFREELGIELLRSLEQLGVEDADMSDGRALADTVYCLGYRPAFNHRATTGPDALAQVRAVAVKQALDQVLRLCVERIPESGAQFAPDYLNVLSTAAIEIRSEFLAAAADEEADRG